MRVKLSLFLPLILLVSLSATAQRFLTDMMDTSNAVGKGIYPLYNQSDRLRFGGYMQPQFQYAEAKGVKNYSGGDFSGNSDNRFMLRRGRIRIDYLHNDAENRPLAYFAFQFDGTERGVAIRDFWGRFYENKLSLFSLTMGMFARPMGFEANYSSSEREAPERGRMSQILMKTERDLGAMLTIENRTGGKFMKWAKLDVGVFNGQGLACPSEYDNHKDVIGRFSIKPRKLKKAGLTIAGSVSGYYGGIVSQSPWLYTSQEVGGKAVMKGDSTPSNVGYIAARKYIGADIQIKTTNQKWATELRAEYIRGLQSGTAGSSETPGSYPVTTANAPLPLYTRSFDGAYLYLLQNIAGKRHLLILKYDWYDPNTKAAGKDVVATSGYSAADVKYSTAGFGYLYHINSHVKVVFFYDMIMNEETSITGYTKDIKDNIFTCRVQYRF